MLGLAFLFVYLLKAGNATKDKAAANNYDPSDPSDSRIRISAYLEIDYTDAEGSSTRRQVAGQFYDPHGGYLIGRCSLRADVRTFRLDRIQSATDLETGEVLNTKRLRSYLRSKRFK